MLTMPIRKKNSSSNGAKTRTMGSCIFHRCTGTLPAVIYAHGYDVYEDIGDYTKDVLILHGDADTIVPLSSSKRAQDIYDHAELLVLPGSGHDFYGEAQQEAIDAILGYLRDSYD